MNFFITVLSCLCALVVVTDAVDTKANAYRGCYEYKSNNSLVSDYPTKDNITLTPQKCVTLCAEKKFPFAGLEKDTCHCGFHSPTDLLKRNSSECNIPCPGDRSKHCGGSSKVGVYETGVPTKEIVPSRVYLGCFYDKDPYRVLKEPFQFPNDLTHEKCHRQCYSKGYRYFGLTYVKECWCGDTAPAPDGLKNESECNSICSGNPKEFCGGGYRLAVFATGIPNHSENSRLVSCYRNARNEVKVEYSINLPATATNRRCLNLCYERNFKYSGVQNKSMCTCMNTVPQNYFQDGESNCTGVPCPGDSGDKCSNDDSIRIFRTRHADVNLDTEPKNLGCYVENKKGYPALDGGKIEQIDQLTSNLCVDICKTRGFEFAGVEGGNECYCSHSYPSRYTKTADSDCKIPCVGSKSSNCGGKSKILVFSTGLPRNQASVNRWYLGCYKDDNEHDRVLKRPQGKFADNSVDFCHRRCLQIGYMYFGLTYHKECFCGDEDPFEELLLDDSECSLKCSGNANQKCGGPWRLSTYRTGLYDIPQNETKSLGCFKSDKSNPLLTERKIDLATSNTPTRCTNICDYLGYAYAGVQRRNECRCGNKFPKGLISQPEGKCNYKCPKPAESSKCGGTDHVGIFRTTVAGNGTLLG